MGTLRLGLLTGGIMAALAGAAAGQTGELHLADISNGTTWVVQGGALINQYTRISGGGDSAMAIAGDVRTYGQSGQTGHGYDLAGNYNGNSYAWSGGSTSYDGTTDGANYNYAVAYSSGQVWRYDRNWQGGQMAFQGPSNTLGIGYDALDGSFWIASVGAATIYHYDSGGTQVGSFSTGNLPNAYTCAFDNTDGTIWVASYATNPVTIRGYNRSGTELYSYNIDISNGIAGGVIGMEFNIPAPGAAALLGVGALTAARRRRA